MAQSFVIFLVTSQVKFPCHRVGVDAHCLSPGSSLQVAVVVVIVRLVQAVVRAVT
jgi:hypothetical protein